MPFILAAVLIDMVSIGLMVPVLPHLVGTFTHSNDEQALAFLFVTAAFGVANFFAAPVLGALSDRFGRRPVLLLGFAGLALSFFGTALAPALWVLVVIRLFSGAMQSNISVANAYVADISAPEDRARRFGLVGAMFGIGFILGPVLGGVLGSVDVRLPFFVSGSLALVNGLYGMFVLPESLPAERRRAFEWRRANPVAALRGLRALQGVGPLVGVIALASLAQFMLHMSWVLYTKFKFGWGPAQVGWSLFAVGIVSAIGQGLLLKPLLRRFTPRQLAVAGLLVGSLSHLLFGLATHGWMMYAVIALGLVGGAAQAAMQSIVSNAADARTQGQTMGAVTSLNSLMAVAAPIVALELLRWVADRPAGDWLIGLPFFTSAALLASAATIAMRFFRQHAAPAPAAAHTPTASP
ncbi:MAG: MFS transporter [Rubrivivax sp.]|nr:MFS transporter [Rubrivivax sp.]NLZ41451.1 TCR/Tet family MFS transporter [Comamonadaceae bacterium]